MIVKGIALTALVASTPLALFASQQQDPKSRTRVERPAVVDAARTNLLRAQTDLQRAQNELDGARRDLKQLKLRLESALDRLDDHVDGKERRSHENDCAPSRSRMLMSHFQWLRKQGHGQRAQTAVAKIVKRVGDDAGRLNSVAWDLMTDKSTAGQYDEIALALTKRMEEVSASSKNRRHKSRNHAHLDTAALAQFLNGNVERAIRLQEDAIKQGGRSDDYRRRLRTYQAARIAVAEASKGLKAPTATMVASSANEEDEE
ncbi:MAG: hypothetical protein AB8H80_02275 [Planctomycetota bacterium]